MNSLVSTGAMFSMTLFASTSQDPMMTAPSPRGTTAPINHAAFMPMDENIMP